MNKEPTSISSLSIKLLRTIGSPLQPITEISEEDNESSELYDHAVKNKIPLLYLESLKQQEELNKLKSKYKEEYARYLKFLDGVAKVSEVLNTADIEYAIFKTIKPFPTVHGDADIIILGDDGMYGRAVEYLLKAGYTPKLSGLVDVKALTCEEDYRKAAKILVKPTHGGGKHGLGHISPTGTDFVDPERIIDIDLQKDLALSYVIYMDKNNFKGYITEVELLNGSKIKVPTPELDMAIVIAHSLAEQMYLLGECYAFLYRLSEMDEERISNFMNILKENKLTMAAKSFVTITAVLCKEAYGEVPEKIGRLLDELGYEESEARELVKNNFKIPYKYRWSTLIKIFIEKMGEKRFRRSVGVQMIKMLDPRLMRLVIAYVAEMRKREYYLKEVE